MNDETNTAGTDDKKEATPKPDILRGRMPLPLVYTIKFGHTDLNDSQVADMYRTTSGKVSDVRKNRNFGYITKEQITFAQDQIDGANARIENLADGDAAAVEEVMETAKIRVATAEEQAAFDESRQGSRKKKGAGEAAAVVPAEEQTPEEAEEVEEAEAEENQDDDDGLDGLLD
ncbi:MAG: hypothetical protein CMB80_31105 [Flammeovirgaceae bacterium]|nr:hypothetical protein [Flammeovirgaceae bacterium]